MAITALATEAMEQSSYFIDVDFLDEDGAAVSPNASTIAWTLTDSAGNVINGRDNEAETSAASITIELEGADLAIQTVETGAIIRRHLTVVWEYDSILGNDKPGSAECVFMIRNLRRMPATIA